MDGKKRTTYNFSLRRKKLQNDVQYEYNEQDLLIIKDFLKKKEMPEHYVSLIHNETKDKTGDYKVEIDHVQKKIKKITLTVIVKDE